MKKSLYRRYLINLQTFLARRAADLPRQPEGAVATGRS